MNILFVSHYVPDHNGFGSQRRAANHLDVLRAMGTITIVLPASAIEDESAQNLAEQLGIDRVVVRHEPTIAQQREYQHNAATNKFLRLVKGMRRTPYLDGRARREDRNLYRQELGDNFDLIFAFRMTSALWVDSIFQISPSPSKVVDLDDIESITFAKALSGSNSLFWAVQLRRQLRWIKKVEKDLLHTWSACILCSEIDTARIEQMTGRSAWVVPNAVSFGDTQSPEPSKITRLLFVGTFAYTPNVEGIEWFVDNVWPKVVEALGTSVHLTLVGFNPPQRIMEIGKTPGITVVANAPTLTPHYADTDIVIVPLLTGSGTRIKIIEAASHKRALVTTELGCEGLNYKDGIHAEIADRPEIFSKKIIDIANDDERRLTLSMNAYEHARAKFSKEVVQCELSNKLSSLVLSQV